MKRGRERKEKRKKQCRETARNYPHNLDTTDTIEGPQGSIIRLTFTDFDIQSQGSYCLNDYVSVSEVNGPIILEESCGSSLPPVVYSTGSSVQVIFHTDDSDYDYNNYDFDTFTYDIGSYSGWRLDWAALTSGNVHTI